MPVVIWKASKKYHVAEPIPDMVELMELPSGSKTTISATNSVVMKYSAKNTTNLTRSERTSQAKTVLKAESNIPNIRSLYADRMMNRAIAAHAKAIAACITALLLSIKVQCASMVMDLPTTEKDGFGHAPACDVAEKFRRLGSRLNMGCNICCAVGVGSSCGAPVAGSGPRFCNGLADAGLVVFALGVVAGLVVVAVGFDGKAHGCGLAVVVGLGETKSLTVGVY